MFLPFPGRIQTPLHTVLDSPHRTGVHPNTGPYYRKDIHQNNIHIRYPDLLSHTLAH